LRHCSRDELPEEGGAPDNHDQRGTYSKNGEGDRLDEKVEHSANCLEITATVEKATNIITKKTRGKNPFNDDPSRPQFNRGAVSSASESNFSFFIVLSLYN